MFGDGRSTFLPLPSLSIPSVGNDTNQGTKSPFEATTVQLETIDREGAQINLYSPIHHPVIIPNSEFSGRRLHEKGHHISRTGGNSDWADFSKRET